MARTRQTAEANEQTSEQTEQTAEQTEQQSQNGEQTAETTELDLDFLSEGGMILAEALSAETMPVRARNERQQVMDAKVKAAHENWTAKGKPGDWNSQVKAGVVVTYFPAPDKSADLKKLINKAADFHNTRVKYGSSFVVTEKHIERFNLKPTLLGHEAISFTIMDKKARSTRTTASTSSEGTTEPAEGK